jgi:hypothetical protein
MPWRLVLRISAISRARLGGRDPLANSMSSSRTTPSLIPVIQLLAFRLNVTQKSAANVQTTERRNGSAVPDAS